MAASMCVVLFGSSLLPNSTTHGGSVAAYIGS